MPYRKLAIAILIIGTLVIGYLVYSHQPAGIAKPPVKQSTPSVN